MALALFSAGHLKPEVELGKAVSDFEELLSSEDKLAFRAQRESTSRLPPRIQDVMNLTAQIDYKARQEGSGAHRCFGPRFSSFLEAVQQYAAVGDVVVGVSQNLVACGVWALVRMTLLTLTKFSSYLEKMSLLFMKVGHSAPRYSEAVLLFPQSKALRALLAKYFTTVVRICHRVVSLCQQPLLSRAKLLLEGLNTPKFESDLVDSADAIKEQLYLEHYRETRSSHARIQNIHAWTSERRSAQVIHDHMRLLDMCSTFDYRSPWRRIRKQGNSTWLFDLPQYQIWAESAESRTFVLKGKLGSGKSVLLANMVDDMVLRRPTSPVAYFFCCEDNSESLRSRTILGSIARQLLDTISAEEKVQITENLPSHLDDEAICDLLSSTFAAKSIVFIMLDGLDECHQQQRNAVLRIIEQLQLHIRLAVCSSKCLEAGSIRMWHAATQIISRDTMILPDKRPDIREYIKARLLAHLEDESLSVGDPDIILEIQDALDAGSQGMFLWARLQIEAICLEKTDRAIRKALRNLPDSLPEIFVRILDRCRKLAPKQQDRVLKVISVSARPLSLDEFHDAMGVEPGNTTLSSANTINDVRGLLSCCGSLVYLDEENITLHFVHNSVKQFLLDEALDYQPLACSNSRTSSLYQFTLEEANLEMGGIIVTYLNCDKLNTQISTKIPNISASHAPETILSSSLQKSKIARGIAKQLLKGRVNNVDINVRDILTTESAFFDKIPVRQFHFRHYAREYWLHHTKTIHKSSETFALFSKLITRSELVEEARLWQGTALSYPKVERRFIWAIDNSHLAFLRAERNLHADNTAPLKRSIEYITSMRLPCPKINDDLYVELLQGMTKLRLQRNVIILMPPENNLDSISIDTVVLHSLNGVFSGCVNASVRELNSYLHNERQPPRLYAVLTRCIRLLSNLPVSPMVGNGLYKDVFEVVMKHELDMTIPTTTYDVLNCLITESFSIEMLCARLKNTPDPQHLCNILLEILTPCHDIHWDALEKLIKSCPWLNSVIGSDLCSLILNSYPQRTDLLWYVLSMTGSPEIIGYKHLLSEAVEMNDLHAQSNAIITLLYYAAYSRGPETCCSPSVSDPDHRVFRIKGYLLCECHVPETYKEILGHVWLRQGDAVSIKF